MLATLIPYPKTAGGPATSVTVDLASGEGDLWLRFVIDGDVDAIAWPAPAEGGRADELWRHTCFEAFVADTKGYVEYNLSPSGQWATYRFDGYREGMRPAAEAVVIDGLDGASDMVALEARIELPAGATRLALAVVIEGDDGAISYWALAHPSDKPDFHHPDSFVLDLP